MAAFARTPRPTSSEYASRQLKDKRRAGIMAKPQVAKANAKEDEKV
jgi:hypothetical protein